MFSWFRRAQNFGLSYGMIAILITLSLLTTLTEVFGIGVFLPIFQFMRLEGDMDALIANSSLWQYAVDGFYFFSIEPSLAALLSVSFIFFISRQFFSYIRIIYNSAMRQRLIQTQRNRMFNGYIDADTAYHDSTPVGNFVNVVTTEVNAAVMGVMAPIELMVYIIMLIGYFSALLILSWEMTLASMFVLLVSSLVPNMWTKRIKKTGRNLVSANTLVSEFLVGRLRAPRLVRLSGTEILEKKEFYDLTRAQRKHAFLDSILQARTDVVMEPMIIGFSLVFLYFSYTKLHLPMEVIGLYLVIAMRLMPIVKGIVKQWHNIKRHTGPMEAVEIRLQTMRELKETDAGFKLLRNLKKDIIFNKVNYRYLENEFDTLNNISIKFKSGEMTAIVGPSGSGKSTLVDLFPRLRDPTSGRITIDGGDIREYTLKTLRQLISYVPQSPQIFNGTLKEHILYGKVDATDKEIQEAAYLAGAKEFINLLPKGFETNLGEDAVKLSGGQRQRLDLARALIGKSKILILDEPTSNLDAESEGAFKQALNRIHKETKVTIIIVAHRLSSVIDADQIIVLNRGRIESVGVHTELYKRKGWYEKAWRMQNPDNYL